MIQKGNLSIEMIQKGDLRLIQWSDIIDWISYVLTDLLVKTSRNIIPIFLKISHWEGTTGDSEIDLVQ